MTITTKVAWVVTVAAGLSGCAHVEAVGDPWPAWAAWAMQDVEVVLRRNAGPEAIEAMIMRNPLDDASSVRVVSEWHSDSRVVQRIRQDITVGCERRAMISGCAMTEQHGVPGTSVVGYQSEVPAGGPYILVPVLSIKELRWIGEECDGASRPWCRPKAIDVREWPWIFPERAGMVFRARITSPSATLGRWVGWATDVTSKPRDDDGKKCVEFDGLTDNLAKKLHQLTRTDTANVLCYESIRNEGLCDGQSTQILIVVRILQ